MNSPSCIFCSIINKTIPAQIIAENEHCMVIKDIHPKSPIHLLIITKKHISSIPEMTTSEASVAAGLFLMAQQLGQTVPGAQAFRLLMNNGKEVGQSVFHMHFHFLAGKKMTDF
jgi:histidine triad (HIT) family protein